MNRIGAFISALPDFVMAGVFLITWIKPDAIEDRMVRHLVLVMLLEFIIIHSSAFMGFMVIAETSRANKVKWIVGLALFYSLFAGGFALAFRSWWPILAFWGLTLNRLLPIILRIVPTEREKRLVQVGWAASAGAYLLFAFVTTLLPVPQLGITSDVVDRQDLSGQSDEPGLWQTHPQHAIAFGFLYFTAIGIGEMLAGSWNDGGGAARSTLSRR